MNILITGASGLIGTALTKSLIAAGHNVYPLERKEHSTAPFHWQPYKNIIHLDDSVKLDAVIHLAGENIADTRWDAQRKKAILDSRVIPTKLLASTLAQLGDKPEVFISASAIGFYGDTGDKAVDESSPAGSGYLADVASQWEQASQPAIDVGIRTVNIRTGVVLSTHGGILKQMIPPFKMGLGGCVGNGRQYISYVSINEVTAMIQYLLEHDSISGPINLVAKAPVTNKEFARALGKALHRPTTLPLPAFVARTMFGEMADALLLSSSRVLPARLDAEGYIFKDDDLEATIRSLLDNKQ